MQEKYIDETKQGEAFAIAEKPENSKKLFLESYRLSNEFLRFRNCSLYS